MKKSLLTLLLAVAMAVPVFAADKGAMEVDIKAGIPLSQELKEEVPSKNETYDVETTFSLGADFFYYIDSNIAIGAGVDHIFSSKVKYGNGYPGEDKISYTNIYLQAKYNFVLNNDIFNNIYPIVQLGYGIFSFDVDTKYYVPGTKIEGENGLYCAIGVGTTIKENFIVELLYSFDYGKTKAKGGYSLYPEIDTTYKILKLNIGYKFNI